jgi:hypothetical protein
MASFNTSRPYLADPLPFGELHFHQPLYREFICSKSTAGWLMGGAMQKVNGRTVTLRIKEQFTGGNVAVGYEYRENTDAAE